MKWIPCNERLPKEDEYNLVQTEDGDMFIDRFGDWTARKILSALSGLSTNATTNQHTTRIIFGKEKNPSLIYTDLATGEQYDGDTPYQLPNDRQIYS